MIKKLNKMGSGFVVKFGKREATLLNLSEGQLVYLFLDKSYTDSHNSYTGSKGLGLNGVVLSEVPDTSVFPIIDVGADLRGASVLLDALKKAKQRCPECNYMTPLEGLCSSCVEEKEAKLALICPNCNEAKKPEHKTCFECWRKEKANVSL